MPQLVINVACEIASATLLTMNYVQQCRRKTSCFLSKVYDCKTAFKLRPLKGVVYFGVDKSMSSQFMQIFSDALKELAVLLMHPTLNSHDDPFTRYKQIMQRVDAIIWDVYSKVAKHMALGVNMLK